MRPLRLACAALLLFSCGAGAASTSGLVAGASASGQARMATGERPYDLSGAQSADGRIDVRTTDGGNRWSHLQNRDQVDVTAEFTQGGDRFRVVIARVMPNHPHGSYTTWSGVAYHVAQHGRTGIGTSALPRMEPDISLWGYAEVSLNGRVVASGAPAHVMVMPEGDMRGIVLDVAGEDRSMLGVRDGYLVVHWPAVASITTPDDEQRDRELLGWLVLVGFVALFGWLSSAAPSAPRVVPTR